MGEQRERATSEHWGRAMGDHGTVRRRVAATAVAVGVVLFGIGLAPGVASAHHPLISGQTQCYTGTTWSVTWTVRADADRSFTWQITSPGGYAPSGSQADELPFTRTASYAETLAVASETVSASWSNGATGTSTGSVNRPPKCEVPTTTSTTTTTTTTTTTAPEVTPPTPPPTPETTATTAGPTTTVEQAGPTTVLVGQQGPTSTVDPSSGAAATTTPVGGQLPATGAGDSAGLTVIALTLIGIGAVMFRLASKPSR